METDTKKFFQITEAAHACGLSRSTLMRMEEKGMLTPAFIAPNSGRRYYDNHNVARILQIEKFKAMGIHPEELSEYFIRGGDVSDLLAVLEARLRDIQRSVEEMRLRAGNEAGMSVQIKACLRNTIRLPIADVSENIMTWTPLGKYQVHYHYGRSD